jgi:Zn-dependent protease
MAQSGDAEEIEYIRSVVGKYFPIYDIRMGPESLTIFISPVLENLDENFDRLREELGPKRYIPIIRNEYGEYIIQVMKRPEMRTRSVWVNRIMLLVTFASTVFAGAYLWSGYMDTDLFEPMNFLWGALFFALPLMTILGIHELGHYYMSKRHGVDASLPFFIPSVPPLGTFGAFISMRDPMPSRKALMDIGVAGPLAGLAVTIPVTLLGLFLTAQGNVQTGGVGQEGGLGLSIQPLFQLFMFLIPIEEGVALHPTAFAAWVGFLVTAINLLPSGQLDGGHIARALLGNNARYLSYATIGVLFFMGLYFPGWLFFALIIIFLGTKHPAPLNDITKIGVKRQVVGAVALVILLTTFVPVPVVTIVPDYSFQVSVDGSNATDAMPGEEVFFPMIIENVGNADIILEMGVTQVPSGWGAVLFLSNGTAENATNSLEVDLPYEGNVSVTLRVDVPEGISNETRVLTLESSSQAVVSRNYFTIIVE